METIKVKEREKVDREGFGYIPNIDYGEETAETDNFGENHRQNKKLVLEILETWDKATNSDVLLYFEFLRTKFPEIEVTSSEDRVIFKFPKKLIKYFNSPDSIIRARRSLNAKKLGLPTNPAVIEKRKIREKAIRNYFGMEKEIKRAEVQARRVK